ncbi:unnamed protein product [Lactuca saligna]|uniref:Uncharacterized protein n=1 Tax=Lactuca saligna TaxID=75948 RepID=A0AA36A3G5_LACSI|nr:unnamed protein product [Lactuca saligna]
MGRLDATQILDGFVDKDRRATHTSLGEKHFATITNGYGVTIAPFHDIPYRVDLSCEKISILTDREKMINDEIHVAFEGELIKPGMIESTRIGFRSSSTPVMTTTRKDIQSNEEEEDDAEKDEEEEEGISNTWMEHEEQEREEREIH